MLAQILQFSNVGALIAPVCVGLRKPSGLNVQLVARESRNRGLQHVVGAVAEGLVVGILAAAQIEGARAFGDEAVRLKAVTLCEPSQKGCFAERPQLHQK